MIFRPIFADRADAGRRLAAALSHLAITHPLVLALPRGGVPVAFEVARALGADLDLLLVRKLGVPGHPELGLGAVVDGAEPQLVLNDILIRTLALTPDYIEAELRRQLIEINRRRSAYLGDRVPPPMTRRTVIIVDDGIATGGTMKAALRGARKNRPARLVLAVPVAPREALIELEGECDELVCLAAPDPFYAVGAHYGNFDQTSDAEVISLLAQARMDGRATLTD